MYVDDFFGKYQKEIQQTIDEKRYAVSQGGVDSFDDYKKLCSEINGLELALSIFRDLAKKTGVDEDA
jgi:hypothetical protein